MAAVLEAHIHWLHTITIRQTGKLKQSSLLEMAFWGGCKYGFKIRPFHRSGNRLFNMKFRCMTCNTIWGVDRSIWFDDTLILLLIFRKKQLMPLTSLGTTWAQSKTALQFDGVSH